MKFTDKLYENAKDIWDSCLEHPFIMEMANGNLDIEKYKYYMLQDYAYLRDYIKIFAVIISKSDDFEEIKWLVKNISDVIEETFRVHIPYMKKLGIKDDEVKNLVPHIDNTSYSHYMICEAQKGNVISGLTALLNCSWSYAYIAEKVVEKYPDAINNNYGDWFKAYICEEYKKTNAEFIDTVERLGKNISDTEEKRLCEIFRQCSKYEHRFWNMAYKCER